MPAISSRSRWTMQIVAMRLLVQGFFGDAVLEAAVSVRSRDPAPSLSRKKSPLDHWDFLLISVGHAVNKSA
jgi:hypothetical protein